MKVTSSDLLAILRRFKIADENNVPRHIEQVKQSNPSPINQLVGFRFQRDYYYVLFDETAEDNFSYILKQIQVAKSDASGELFENPTSDLRTYGLPFKGKDAYLYKLVSGKQRLDVLLAERFPESSRSTWQKHIKAGHVIVNGNPAKNAKQDVTPDVDVIAISIPENEDHSDKTLPILYIDDDVIVVNKPVGVLTHSKGVMNDEFTVADFFRKYSSVALDTNRPGIVHRLDRDTSGVIIGARTDQSFDTLKQQFSSRKAKKHYIAIVEGLPKQLEATIDIPIGRNPNAPSTFRADSKGKPAVTDYKVVASDGKRTLVELFPHTGRTHQLRVHMAHIGTPIEGDRVYGKQGDRMYLHAYSLELTVKPETRMTFTAPVPNAFMSQFPEASRYGALPS
ncbi:RluA family pseudouridine synthase [Microbacteriaceae bacterium]|nr:RluA family pseudouridine synthase [Candidatus Saccharibacteria bacterium]